MLKRRVYWSSGATIKGKLKDNDIIKVSERVRDKMSTAKRSFDCSGESDVKKPEIRGISH